MRISDWSSDVCSSDLLSIGSLFYHRSIDDHEEHAWLWAGLAGWYAFALAAPVWWVLHRADLAPPADAMMLFLLSLLVNAVVHLWLKFRCLKGPDTLPLPPPLPPPNPLPRKAPPTPQLK